MTNVWQLGEGWVASVLAALLLDTREGASSRGGDLAKLPTAAVQNKPEADKLIDAAVEVVAQLKGVARGPAVRRWCRWWRCGRFRRARRLRREGHRFQRRARRHRPLRAERARRGRSGSGRIRGRERAVVAAVEAELGSDWPKQVAPRFDANKAILFDDRWASAREDLARAYYDNDPAALNGSFIGLGKTIAAEAQWFANESESEELKAVFQKAGSEALEQVASNKNASRYANDIAIARSSRLLSSTEHCHLQPCRAELPSLP